MRKDFYRLLLALIAQVSADALPDAEGLEEACTRVRQAALEWLLFDAPSGPAAGSLPAPAKPNVPGPLRVALEECLSPLPGTIERAIDLDDRLLDALPCRDPLALKSLIGLVSAYALHANGNVRGDLRLSLEHVDSSRRAARPPELGRQPAVRLSWRLRCTPGSPGLLLQALFGSRRNEVSSSPGYALARQLGWSLGGAVSLPVESGDQIVCDVYLPCSVHKESSNDMMRPKLGLQVLYVSGEEAILSMGQESLVRSGCGVQVACDGHDAIRVLERAAEQFDVVVAEQVLTDMSGAELARRIHERRPEKPVVVATDQENEDLEIYILYPFSANQLRDAVCRAASPGPSV